jgi:uncharacterized protein DUF6221
VSSDEELAAFVAARLDEDEAAANAGARRVGMPWRAEPQPGTPGGLVLDELGLVGSTGGRYAAAHIARHDPARVLREVAATRALIAAIEHPDPNQGPEYGYGLRLALMYRAAIHGDHPDYDQEWKP